MFRVDAVDLGDLQILHHDGLWGSSIWRYDGTRATTARFDTDDRQIPWAALGRTPDRILIIGAAGGNEIQAALTYGVGQVDAVELNPVTHHLLTDTFAEYSGNIANLPNVNYVQGDGRTFLARSSARLRPDLVRRPRLVRRVQRRDVGRLRALGELPLHARDDRDRVRSSRRRTA